MALISSLVLASCTLLIHRLTDAAPAFEANCYAKNKNPYLYFALNTAYDTVAGVNETADIPQCRPAHIWMLVRHGTRYPSSFDLHHGLGNRILSQLQDKLNTRKGKPRLCDEDLRNLLNWKESFSVENNSLLARQGREEMWGLARRTKSRFPSLFRLNQEYNPKRIILRSTVWERSYESGKEFVKKFFNKEDIELPDPIRSIDPLLEFYKEGSAWEEPKSLEAKLFEQGKEMSDIAARITHKLNFQHNISNENVTKIYDICTLESAVHNTRTSPWCALFTTEDLKVLEYYKDLETYYEFKYNDESLNEQLTEDCPLVGDLLQRMSKFEKQPNGLRRHQPVASFYFAHSTGLKWLLRSLRIGQQNHQPLRANNYSSNTERVYRSSLLLPFAGNFAAVFYKCREGNKIAFYANERLYHFDGCDDGLCDWEMIKNKFGRKSGLQ